MIYLAYWNIAENQYKLIRLRKEPDSWRHRVGKLNWCWCSRKVTFAGYRLLRMIEKLDTLTPSAVEKLSFQFRSRF